MNLIHKTKSWLLDNNILVPDDWITACVEWIQEEHQGMPQSQDQINSLVYEQWLLADLHELETRCLPNSVVSADKFQLTGAYALQIDSILDIGQSFYSQQQKVKGTENANVGVSAEEQQLKPWEQKPTRMLMFKLTDGSQTVQGMEYRPINSLSPQTQPGSKILVYGSVLCRHGVLMLGEDNIKFLGGEVDTLVEANTLLNVLQSAMEASTEHAGKSHRQEFEGSDVRPSQKPNTKPSCQRFGANQTVSHGIKMENKTQGLIKQEKRFKKEFLDVQNQQRTDSNFEDQWDDDQIFDALVDDMEMDEFQQPQHNNTSMNVNRQTENIHQTSMSTTAGSSFNTKSMGRASAAGNHSENNLKGNHSNAKRNLDMKLPKKEVTSMKTDFSEDMKANFASLGVKRQKIMAAEEDYPVDEFEDDVDFSDIKEYEQMDSDWTEQNIVSRNNINPTVGVSNAFSRHIPTSDTLNHQQQSDNFKHVKRETLKAVKTEPPLPPSTSHNASMSAIKGVKSKANVAIDRFFSPGKATTSEVKDSIVDSEAMNEYPFTYLSMILRQRPSEAKFVTVKAFISTLTSKLSHDSGRWSLSCKINDGTEACDVDLSDRVLTDLIGFSTEDAMVMKQRARTDKSIRDTIQKGIQQCQKKLIDLMCLMELDVRSQKTKPTVVALKQISPNDFELLHNRVSSSWNKMLQ